MTTTLTPPVVTAFAAAVLITLQTALMLVAALTRRASKQALGGEAGQPALQRAVRRHGNLAENAAIFLIGLALFEMLGGPKPWAIILAVVFVAARLSHAAGLSMANTVNPFRITGVIATVFVGFTLAVRLGMLAWARI